MVHLTQTGHPTEMGRSTRMARLESSSPLTISNGCVPPDGFIGPVERGPSLEVPLTMVLCPSGVSEAWLCSALFRKALFHFLLFQTSDFPKWSVFLATLLRLLPRLNLFVPGHLRDSFPSTRQPGILEWLLQCDSIPLQGFRSMKPHHIRKIKSVSEFLISESIQLDPET